MQDFSSLTTGQFRFTPDNLSDYHRQAEAFFFNPALIDHKHKNFFQKAFIEHLRKSIEYGKSRNDLYLCRQKAIDKIKNPIDGFFEKKEFE